jgi:hypothetical protein
MPAGPWEARTRPRLPRRFLPGFRCPAARHLPAAAGCFPSRSPAWPTRSSAAVYRTAPAGWGDGGMIHPWVFKGRPPV